MNFDLPHNFFGNHLLQILIKLTKEMNFYALNRSYQFIDEERNRKKTLIRNRMLDYFILIILIEIPVPSMYLIL